MCIYCPGIGDLRAPVCSNDAQEWDPRGLVYAHLPQANSGHGTTCVIATLLIERPTGSMELCIFYLAVFHYMDNFLFSFPGVPPPLVIQYCMYAFTLPWASHINCFV